MCFMCLLFSELIAGKRRRANKLFTRFRDGVRGNLEEEKGRRGYFDKINWCAIVEGVVVRKFMTGIFHASVMCAQQYFLST